MTPMDRFTGAFFIALLASACNGAGSLGEHETDSDSNSGSTGGDSGDDGGPGDASASESESGSASAESGSASAESGSASAESGSASAESGGTDTGNPGQCEGEGNCVLFPISCDDVTCGGTSSFDENGCVRAPCGASPESCADGERCYRPMDFGGCASSAGCVDDESSMTCQCGSLPDCGGAWCLPEALWPEPEPGPSASALVETDCAPNDGPAFALRLGLTGSACDAVPPVGAPSIAIRIDSLAGSPGEYLFGAFAGGQGNYDPGDGNTVLATGGRVVIDTWTGDTVTGSYDIHFEDGTFLAADFDAAACLTNPKCG